MKDWKAAWCLVPFLLSGCDDQRATPAISSVRDSAGIRIVEYAGVPQLHQEVLLPPEPIYRHGDSPDEYLFQRVWVGALQPDGSALVSDARNQELVQISADGSSWSVFARSGQGPGEVRGVLSILVLGQDTVLIEDDGNARFAVFEDGAVSQTISTAGSRDLGRGLRSYGMAPGRVVLMGTSSYRSGFPDPWLPGHLVRVSLDGLRADTIAAYDMAPHQERDGPWFPFMPFGEVAAADGNFVTGRSDRAEIRWLGEDGAPMQLVRWQPNFEYPTAAQFEAFLDYLRADLRRINPGLGGAELEEFVSEQASQYELVLGKPFPLFMSIQGDDEGRIWLEHYNARGVRVGAPGFTVFGPGGEWIGQINTPPSFRLLDVAAGRILGVETDEMEVEHVVVYEIQIP